MKKKKGFTLIELIAALAILSIGLSGVSFAFSTSSQLRMNEDVKLDTSTSSQTIVESFRAKGKNFTDTIYNTGAKYIGSDGSSSVYKYLFFTSIEDLNTNINNNSFVSVSGTGSFSDCKASIPSGNPKFGALIQVIDDTGSNSYTLYKINCTVWNLSYGATPYAQLTFYIGS